MECLSSISVRTFADEALLDKAPEHVAAVVAIRGLVKGFLAEAVAVQDGRLLRRARLHRRHYFSVPPFTPDFYRELALATRIFYWSMLFRNRTRTCCCLLLSLTATVTCLGRISRRRRLPVHS